MMARRIQWLLLLGLVVLTGGCPGEDPASESQEILITEDVGGAIDAELSTDEDPRGRTLGSSSAGVLPPGFPAELPLPAGVSLVESGAGGPGKGAVAFEGAAPAETLMVTWLSLLETEGWVVNRSTESAISATRGEQTISAVISPSGAGSRLRIVY